MAHLFIDSTYDLTIGILDDGLRWLSFEKIEGVKASAVIQTKAFELLSRHNLEASSLTSIITVNGPGFYTGLRLAEGFSDVFKFFGVNQYSFYSYEIPAWCGYDKGIWFTKAYRGEYFMFEWINDEKGQKLVSVKELPESIRSDEQYFIHSPGSLDALSSGLIKSPVETHELLKKYPEMIFKNVIGLKREPFYFRAPEDEFKANP